MSRDVGRKSGDKYRAVEVLGDRRRPIACQRVVSPIISGDTGGDTAGDLVFGRILSVGPGDWVDHCAGAKRAADDKLALRMGSVVALWAIEDLQAPSLLAT